MIGRSFWPVAVGVDEDVIDSLRGTGLVSDSAESAMGGMREFAFKHSLTRDVVYSTLPRPERRDLHRQVAEWVQEVARDRGVEAAELAAYHYGEALRYGEDDPAVTRRAVDSLLTAGDAAISRADLDAARAHLERALKFADDDARPTAHLVHSRLEYIEGNLEGVLRELELIEAQLGPEDAELRSEMLGWRSRVSWLTGRWDETFSSANAAVAALDGLPESPQLARALARRSQIEMLKHHDDAIPHAEEAIAVARRVGDLFAEVNARINLFTEQASWGIAPDPDELLAIVDLAREAGVYDEAYRAIVNFLWSAPGYIPLDEAERAAVEARRHLGDVTPPSSIAFYVELSRVNMLSLSAGRWHEVDEVIGTPDEAVKTMATNRIVWLALVGGMAMRRGDLQAAQAPLEEVRSMALATGEAQRIVPMACVVVPWLVVAGRSEELRSLVEEVTTTLDGRWPATQTAVPMVRGLAAANEATLLQQTVDSMRRTPSDGHAAMLLTTMTAGEGLLALLQGQADDAVERLTAAVDSEREAGFVYDAACLELDLARALEAQGRADAASEARARAASVLGRARRGERLLAAALDFERVDERLLSPDRLGQGILDLGGQVAQALEGSLLSLLEHLCLSLKRLVALGDVALRFFGLPLRRLAHLGGLFLRVCEQSASLLLDGSAVLRPVRVGAFGDVARVRVRLGARLGRLARQLLDSLGGLLLRLAHDFRGGHLGRFDDGVHLRADVHLAPRVSRLPSHGPGLFLWMIGHHDLLRSSRRGRVLSHPRVLLATRKRGSRPVKR